MTLTEFEYIWGVSEISKDDGHTVVRSRFTNKGEADNFAREVGGHTFQETLWKGSDGEFYKVTKTLMAVDMPRKKDVLAKLTEKEKRVLGL